MKKLAEKKPDDTLEQLMGEGDASLMNSVAVEKEEEE